MRDWNQILTEWFTAAIADISKLLHYDIEVNSIHIGQVPPERITDLLGGNDDLAVGIYQRLPVGTGGRIMIAYQLKIAHMMLETLFGDDIVPSKSLTEVRQSAICEVGNLIMKSFITVVMDALGLGLKPSLPVILVDSVESITGIASEGIAPNNDTVFTIDAELQLNGKSSTEKFIVIVCGNLMRASVGMVAEPV
jgi:chemotaxis protein CheC